MSQLMKISQRSSLMNFLRLNARNFSSSIESSKPKPKDPEKENVILSIKTHKGKN
jgi:hypothetical protein